MTPSAAAVGFLSLILISALVALPSARAQSTVEVLILSSASDPSEGPGYLPDTITVVVGVNNTVVWKNDDENAHTVTSFNTTDGKPDFDSSLIGSGHTFTYTFTQPGSYPYHCTIHSWMIGFVVVKPSTSPVPEFPSPALALTLFAVMAAALVIGAPRHSHANSASNRQKD